MESKATGTVTPVALVKFGKSKEVRAIAMTDKQVAAMERVDEEQKLADHTNREVKRYSDDAARQDAAGNQSSVGASSSWSQADITAPVLSSPGTSSVTDTGASCNVTTATRARWLSC